MVGMIRIHTNGCIFASVEALDAALSSLIESEE